MSPRAAGRRASEAAQRRVTRLPLPLRAVWEAVGPLMAIALAAVLPVAALGLRDGLAGLSRADIAGVAGINFLVNQGVPVQVALPEQRGLSAVSGTLTLTPLLMVLVLVWLSALAGRRLLAVAGSTSRFAGAALVFAATVGAVDALVAVFSSFPAAQAHVLGAAVIPALWSLLGLLLGGIAEAGGLVAFAGRRRWLQAKGQWWRWGADYASAVFRGIGVALLCLLGCAALFLSVSIAAHWAPILAGYEAVSTSAVGAVAVTLAHAAYLPNLLVWTASWLTGAGFAFGTDTLASPMATTMGAVPPFPLLAAMPTHVPGWAMAAMLVPVACGGVAAWWFVREGEDHLGEWLELRMGPGAAAASLGFVLNSLILGLGTGIAGALAALAARGSLGVGRFTDVGPDPVQVLWMLGLEVFLGALVGFVVVPWLESD
ncbi:DUF6350 family protein [Arthrobacter sp. UM1]|uniref:cell division protein PerM n=1 Tax=Arthrobacter sp. UM1 TaxID=2766776 RepID=UPI001CF6238B|nr:DUF6350 family protein [Arthrobacter sp. UM1]MCB4207887.1 hypothetical protein [Arthrobacter sp. UM1]